MRFSNAWNSAPKFFQCLEHFFSMVGWRSVPRIFSSPFFCHKKHTKPQKETLFLFVHFYFFCGDQFANGWKLNPPRRSPSVNSGQAAPLRGGDFAFSVEDPEGALLRLSNRFIATKHLPIQPKHVKRALVFCGKG